MAKSIDIAELNRRLSTAMPMTLLDVRRKADADANPRCIAGAVYRDPEKIDDWARDLPAGKPAVIYCVKGGSVSHSVAERLGQDGMEAVFLEGGLKAWMDNGLETVATNPKRKP